MLIAEAESLNFAWSLIETTTNIMLQIRDQKTKSTTEIIGNDNWHIKRKTFCLFCTEKEMFYLFIHYFFKVL